MPEFMFQKSLPVVRNVDVLVCGGGSAGSVAAIAAGRLGARVLVIESGFALGGMSTCGLLGRFGPFHDQQKFILGGLPREILDDLVDMKGALQPKPASRDDKRNYWLPYSPEVLKVLLDRLAINANVEILFDSRVAEPILEDDRITGVVVANKNGLEAIHAKVVIDATGDGDIAAAAGIPTRVGREPDGMTQPVTMAYYAHGIEHAKAWKYYIEHLDEMKEIRNKEAESGKDVPDWIALSPDNFMHSDAVHFNVDHVFKLDASNPWNRSQATLDSRRQVWANIVMLRTHVLGCDNAYLGATGSLLGVRETRRIKGEYELTVDDVETSRDFDDGIARYHCYVDIHVISPEMGRGERYGIEPKPGTSYSIPYRSLLPVNINNLLVAGRCISATHEALASVRMIPACMAMGQAVGTAASLCAQLNTTPKELDVQLLRSELTKQNVIL